MIFNGLLGVMWSLGRGIPSLRPEGGGGGGGGGKSFKKPKKLLFPKSIHFLTTEILLPLIYL